MNVVCGSLGRELQHIIEYAKSSSVFETSLSHRLDPQGLTEAAMYPVG